MGSARGTNPFPCRFSMSLIRCLVFTLLLTTSGVHIGEKKISASHSLRYFYTTVTPGVELPEFTAVGTVDDVQFMYYDSNSRKMIPKTEWMEESEAADYWERETPILTQEQQFFIASLGIATAHFNHTQGVHTLQNIHGCEWDDASGATERFDQYAYDGEDFITLNNEFWDFMALLPEAVFLEQKWNDHPDQLEHRKQFLTHECVERLQKYVRYGNSSLERTVPPQVSLLQKDPSSPVTCHVTGFYPLGVVVTWQKNGQDLDLDVELGETVPNGDGTFQTRSHLRVKPEDWKKDRYTCTVQHKSLEQDIILTVTEENIIAVHTQIYPDRKAQARGIIIILVVFLLIAFVIICVLICTNKTSVPPQVSLLQKDPSSPVTCHVTGFYPGGVMVTWKKNGQELDVDVELGEMVPNGDGTFQTRSHLRVKPEDWKRDRYTCTVQHKSLEQDIILTVTEENIRMNVDIILPFTEENIKRNNKTSCINPDSFSFPVGIIGLMGGALLTVTLIAIVIISQEA